MSDNRYTPENSYGSYYNQGTPCSNNDWKTMCVNSNSNRLIYDKCFFEQRTAEATSQLHYNIFGPKYENCNKCQHQANRKLNVRTQGKLPLVDIESELRNINRLNSRCDTFKYNPNCTNQNICISKNDPRVFTEVPPRICDIRPVTIPKPDYKGYELPNQDICQIRAWHTQ